MNLQSEFLNVGLVCNNPILDGVIHRVPTINKPKSLNGWYSGFYVGNHVCLTMGDWLTGLVHTYKSWKDDNELSRADLEAIEKEQAELKKKAEAEKAKRHKDAATKATQQWLALSDTGNSVYLLTKQVKGYGVKFGSDFIAIPIQDHVKNIKGLQYIKDDGSKKFTFGTEKKGGFFVIGEISPFNPVCFAEGYATAASIHEATGYPVIVCFDAGNIKPVVESWRVKYPQQHFVICADNDFIGIDKASSTAKLFDCQLIICPVPTDFNDLHVINGIDALKSAICPKLTLKEEFKQWQQPQKTSIKEELMTWLS